LFGGEIEHPLKSGTMHDEFICYQFSRQEVERADFKHFLSLYGLEKLPANRQLQDLMNRFIFSLSGWDEDPREIHTIPEIRRFYSAFHEAWPYWLYFCNLDNDTLKPMTMCCLPSVNTIEVDGQFDVAVTCNPLDLFNLLTQDFLPMNLMCERAGLDEDRIFDRTKALFEYFGLPFDEQPPALSRD
jgi:hypothetical protein